MAESSNFRAILRIGGVDVLGEKQLYYGLCRVRGVSFSFANALCKKIGLDRSMRSGDLSDEQLEKVNNALKKPSEVGIPSLMKNRRKDPTTGEDNHVTGADRDFTKMNDIARLRKTKTYRGMRHAYNLPTRGQRTRSHFRKGTSLGVKRKKK